jgi:hypothetical protein
MLLGPKARTRSIRPESLLPLAFFCGGLFGIGALSIFFVGASFAPM